MTQQYANAVPIINLPYLNINNMQVSRASNTTLLAQAGLCRDQSDTYDMNLGDFGSSSPSTTTCDTAVVGYNGIDTGVLEASKMYHLYAISDPVSGLPSGLLLSLDAATPIMPYGYSAYRKIAYWPTDSSVHFIVAYNSGNGNARSFWYDAIQPSPVTAGNATSYTAIDLTGIVPVVDNTPVLFTMGLTPNAASDTASFVPTGGTGDSYVMKGQVAAVQLLEQVKLLTKLATGKPEISYKVSASSDALAVSVIGFDYWYYVVFSVGVLFIVAISGIVVIVQWIRERLHQRVERRRG